MSMLTLRGRHQVKKWSIWSWSKKRIHLFAL